MVSRHEGKNSGDVAARRGSTDYETSRWCRLDGCCIVESPLQSGPAIIYSDRELMLWRESAYV